MSGASISASRERYAIYGPPEGDELISSPAATEDAISCVGAEADRATAEVRPASPASALKPSEPDYGSVFLAVSLPFLSLTVSHTRDGAGHDYYGLGAGVGVAPPVAIGASAGKLVRDDDHRATAAEIRNFLCGDAVSVRAGIGADADITNGAGGTAIEWGAATAVGASAGFSHNWGEDCE